MDMFVAPGAIDVLQNERQQLQKTSEDSSVLLRIQNRVSFFVMENEK